MFTLKLDGGGMPTNHLQDKAYKISAEYLQ